MYISIRVYNTTRILIPVLEYCSAVFCSAADTHLKLLDRVVSGASFLTELCLSVTLQIVDLWQYYVCCTRSGVTRLWCSSCAVCPGAGFTRRCNAHRYTYEPPRCRTSQYSRTIILFSVSLWNDLSDPVFDGVGLAGFSGAGPMPLYWPSCSLPFCLLLFSHSLLSFYGLVLWGWGLRTDRVLITLSQPCITNLFLIIIMVSIGIQD